MTKHLSGEVRFSVESLLHYAPKIITTGETLAGEVNAVRQRLIGLGDFFGHSWMEESFRNMYPRGQYAMMLVAWALANEIQAIGGGIQQMAQEYGVAEDQNTADVTRIRQNETRTSRVIHGTGGIQPPAPTHPNLPTPPRPPREPNPRPGPPPDPHPPAYHPYHPPPAYHPPAHSNVPQPRPGVNPANYRRGDQVTIFGPWPDGDTGRLYEAATAWTRLLSALDTAWTDLRRFTAYIMADAQGAAADAFNDYVDGLTAAGHGSLTQAIQACQDLHDMCVHQAEEVSSTRRQLEQAAAEFALETAATLAVVYFTAAAAAAVEEAVAEGFLFTCARIAGDLLQAGGKIAKVVDVVGTALSKAVPGGLQSAVIGQIDQVIHGELNQAFGKKGDPGELSIENLAKNFGAGAVGGIISGSGKAASGQLNQLAETVAEKGGDRGTIRILQSLARQVDEGKINVAAVNSAVSNLITEGKITPRSFIEGTISRRLSSAVNANAGN